MWALTVHPLVRMNIKYLLMQPKSMLVPKYTKVNVNAQPPRQTVVKADNPMTYAEGHGLF